MPTPQPTVDEHSGAAAGSDEPLHRIEQVAALTGMTKRTLRYYEEIGLLEPPTRTEGGYRLYTSADIQRLLRIKRLKDLLGFELKEIRAHVRVEEEREQVRSAYERESDPQARLSRLDDAEALVREQLRLVDEKLAGLREMRASLVARLERYDLARAELRARITASS